MKTAYKIFLCALAVCALSWFLPWLYSFAFPTSASEPFVAYSPTANAFVISENGDKPSIRIEGLDKEFSKDERDTLLPQIYFPQLAARDKLPDSIAGKEVTLPILKQTQWVFTSLPMDINKRQADWHLIMESMPKRFALEDPTEVFSLSDGNVRFVTMDDNSPNEKRGQRFTKAFAEKGFAYPARHMTANITSRKAFDEGYLMVDAQGGVYHMKMRAGTPYLAKVDMPKAKYAFVLENNDRKVLGIVSGEDGATYLLERDGYAAKPLEGMEIDPAKNRIAVMGNMFNIVVRSRGNEGMDWWAYDADTYKLLGHYRHDYGTSTAEKAAEWIFPFRLSFTDVDDSYAYPRITDFSPKSMAIYIVVAIVLVFILRRRKK